MSNSFTAFQLSGDTLARQLPVDRFGRRLVFLWTWTTPDKNTLDDLMARWNLFTLALRRYCKKTGTPLPLLRVVERHEEHKPDCSCVLCAPGAPYWHGYHIHGLTSVFFPIDVMRDLCRKAGFGRVNVKRVPVKVGASYLAGYLWKQIKRRDPEFQDRRMWQAVNFPEYTRTANVELCTFASWFCRMGFRVIGVMLRRQIGRPFAELCADGEFYKDTAARMGIKHCGVWDPLLFPTWTFDDVAVLPRMAYGDNDEDEEA